MDKIHKRGFLFRYAICFITVLLAGADVSIADVPGVIKTTGGKSITGVIRYQPASRVYIITDKKTGVSMRIAIKQVASVRAEKPVKLEGAVKAVLSGQYTGAIPVLNEIIKNYQMLEWDMPAARWLAEAYLKMKNATEAVQICEKIIDNYPASALPEDLTSIYWKALLEDEQFGKLKKALGKVIEEGSREAAAAAQIKRGDIYKKEGKLQEALVDGYLRTIVLFEEVKQVQPEALYNAIKCFEELGEHSHAEKMRKKILAEFPQNPYTQKIKSGM